jgi:hypothetical protein
MSPTTQPPAITAPQIDHFGEHEHRFICNALRLHLFCALARCRRQRRCAGDPHRCQDTHAAAVPPDARTFAQQVLIAARYDRVRAGSGAEWLNESCRQEMAAFNAWDAQCAARRGAR